MKALRAPTRRVPIAAHRPSSTVLGVIVAIIAITPLPGFGSSATTGSAAENWKSECGSCHIAYPPKLLAAPAWRRMMSGLDKHFGADATMDVKTAAEIASYLEQNAGTGRRASNSLRITQAVWFQRKHDEVRSAIWKGPAVKSPANCGACHTDAERGEFREHNIRIPR